MMIPSTAVQKLSSAYAIVNSQPMNHMTPMPVSTRIFSVPGPIDDPLSCSTDSRIAPRRRRVCSLKGSIPGWRCSKRIRLGGSVPGLHELGGRAGRSIPCFHTDKIRCLPPVRTRTAGHRGEAGRYSLRVQPDRIWLSGIGLKVTHRLPMWKAVLVATGAFVIHLSIGFWFIR